MSQQILDFDRPEGADLLESIARLPATERFPVDFQSAWRWVGYSRKDHAKHALLEAFVEGIDFSREIGKSTGGRPQEAILLSRDCFKQFCMMTGTEKGRKVREYFIRCEQKLHEIQKIPKIPKTYAEALRLAADQAEQIEAQERALQVAEPKVKYFDRCMEAGNTELLSVVAKKLGFGPNRFIEQLRRDGILYKRGDENLPVQRYLDEGYFVVRDIPVEHQWLGGPRVASHSQTRVTPKGKVWLEKKYRGVLCE